MSMPPNKRLARRRWKTARRSFARAVVEDRDARDCAFTLARACDRLAPLLASTTEDWRACRRWRRLAVNVIAGHPLRSGWLARIRAIAGAQEEQ